MKLFAIFLTLMSLHLFAEENGPCEGSECDQEQIVFDNTQERFTDQEIEESYDTTEKTLENIGRDIAGTIEEE